jgi:hypothetical protein
LAKSAKQNAKSWALSSQTSKLIGACIDVGADCKSATLHAFTFASCLRDKRSGPGFVASSEYRAVPRA